jgi:hypothetical protein
MTNDDVLAARAERVTRAHGHHVARLADHLQTAHHAPSVQITVVQLILLDNIVVQTVQILVGE